MLGKKQHKCLEEDCNEEFDSYVDLQCHAAQHNWGPHEIRIDSNGKAVFQCLIEGCGKLITSNRKVLRKHLISHQKPTIKCTYSGCNRMFHEKSKLKRHFLVHTGEKTYKCEHDGCDKWFAYKANMKTHLLTHEGLKPFHCEWSGCKKRFSQECNRAAHMHKHRRGPSEATNKRKFSQLQREEEWELRIPVINKRKRFKVEEYETLPSRTNDKEPARTNTEQQTEHVLVSSANISAASPNFQTPKPCWPQMNPTVAQSPFVSPVLTFKPSIHFRQFEPYGLINPSLTYAHAMALLSNPFNPMKKFAPPNAPPYSIFNQHYNNLHQI